MKVAVASETPVVWDEALEKQEAAAKASQEEAEPKAATREVSRWRKKVNRNRPRK